MSSIISLVIRILRGKLEPEPCRKPQSKVPKFLLTESMDEYRSEVERRMKEIDEKVAMRNEKRLEFLRLAEECDLLKGSKVEMEINRRKAKKLRLDAFHLEEFPGYFTRNEYKGLMEYESAELIRQKERETIASQGEILMKNRSPGSENESYSDCAYRRTRYWDIEDRVLISFAGKIFVALLRTPAEVSKGKIWKMGCDVIGGTFAVYTPTGNYGKMEVDWVTDSVSQMNQQELLFLKSRESC
jgi:hypothetical protein